VRLLITLGTLLLMLGSVWLMLRVLSWIVRQPFLYYGTIRGFAATPVPPGALLFTGSSSIRFWSTLAADFAPWPVVNRGFGGAVMSQVVHFERQLVPESPPLAAIVVYCGGNDVAWGVHIDAVVADFERFLAFAKERAPNTPVYLISVGKTPGRRLSWRRVEALNQRLRELAASSGARFVDVTAQMLDARGKPRRGLYLFDGIHPSRRGYAVWTEVLRARFERELVAHGGQ
jgi:lysophospholipase L1-like esterase